MTVELWQSSLLSSLLHPLGLAAATNHTSSPCSDHTDLRTTLEFGLWDQPELLNLTRPNRYRHPGISARRVDARPLASPSVPSLISRLAQPWLGRLSAQPRDWPTNHHHQRTGHKLCRIALFDLGLHGLQHTTHRAFSSLTAPLESSPWSGLQLQLREVAVLTIKTKTPRLFRESRFRNSKRNKHSHILE